MKNSDKEVSGQTTAEGKNDRSTTDSVVTESTAYKPISTREYFKLLAYCLGGLVAIVVVIVGIWNFLV